MAVLLSPPDARRNPHCERDPSQCAALHYELEAKYWPGPGAADAQFDADFYNQPTRCLASAEYGVGAGRLLPLVKPTYGVDASASMLARCRELSVPTEFIRGDLRTVRLPTAVSYSFVAGMTLSGVGDEFQVAAVLKNILRNSTPSCEVRFDVASTYLFDTAVNPIIGRWLPRDSPTGFERYSLSAGHYLHEFVYFRADGWLETHCHERGLDPSGIERIVFLAGFDSCEIYRDPSRSDLSKRTHQFFVIANRRG